MNEWIYNGYFLSDWTTFGGEGWGGSTWWKEGLGVDLLLSSRSAAVNISVSWFRYFREIPAILGVLKVQMYMYMYVYSGTPLFRIPLEQVKVSWLLKEVSSFQR